jgi:hypothetical protein
MERRLNFFSKCVEFFLIHDACSANLAVYRPFVTHGLDNVARASLTFGTDEGCTFGNTTQGFTEIPGATYKWHFEGMLVDVVFLIRRGQNLRFIDVVNTNRLKNLPSIEHIFRSHVEED